MGRQILGNEPNRQPLRARMSADLAPGVRPAHGTKVSLRRRSGTYLNLLRQLDTGGAVKGVDVAELRAAIDAEFPMPSDVLPQGLVGRCYLGHPYEVHTLDLSGEIIEHYQSGRPLPGLLELHRALAQSPHYLAIEVYSDRVVCIRDDGTTIERRND